MAHALTKLEIKMRGDFEELCEFQDSLQKANINVIDLYSDWIDDDKGKHVLMFEITSEILIGIMEIINESK